MKKINLLLLLAMISLKLLCQQDNEMVLDSMVTYEWDSENSEWNERNYSCFHGGCVGGQFEYQYDINGNQTEVIIFFRESETNNKINYLRIVFTYNAKGNQTELIGYEWDHETDDWIPSNVYSHMNPRGGRNVSHYDANENLTEEMFYFSDNNTNEWVYQRRVFYTYDARGNQTEEMLYAWDSETNNWRNYRRHVKTYDDNGNQAEYIPYSWNSETNDWQHCTWQDRRESNYDANGNLTEDIYYNWEYETSEWKNNRRYVYIYGSEGNQTEYFHYRGNEKTNDWKGYRHHIYAYDTNGNQTEDLEYWWSDYINDWVKKSQTIYTYDANGNTTGENSYEWEGEIIGWIKGGRVDYTYDSNGNQTEFTRYGWDREINDWIYEWKELSYWSYPLLPYQSFYVNENCSDSSILGTLITVSSYPQENITFNITGGDPDHIFSVDTIAGDVRLINSCDLDYETTSSYRLTVEAHFEDSTVKITDKAAIMIYVNNMNDNIPVVYDTIFSLYSKSHGGTIVGQVNARDADGNLNPHTFSIIEGNPDNTFAIDRSSGLIILAYKVVLDNETQDIYTLTVQVSDGTFSDEATITILITDIDLYSDGNIISNSRIKIYPNPVSDILCIEIPECLIEGFEVEMFSITGGVILHKSGYLEHIDMSEFQRGVYLIKITTEKATMVGKVIIQ